MRLFGRTQVISSAFLTLMLAAWCGATPPVLANGGADNKQDNNSATQNKVEFAGEKAAETNREALEEVQQISKDIQELKVQVIDLNKDLRLMEEKLLFPSSTKYSVFLSLSTGRFFQLEGIKFKLDGKFVASHVYSAKQRQALARGGIHRLHVTNLSEGKHTATAFFTGIGSNDRPYKRAVSLDFTKGPGSEYLEIAVSDDGTVQEPIFELKQW